MTRISGLFDWVICLSCWQRERPYQQTRLLNVFSESLVPTDQNCIWRWFSVAITRAKACIYRALWNIVGTDECHRSAWELSTQLSYVLNAW